MSDKLNIQEISANYEERAERIEVNGRCCGCEEFTDMWYAKEVMPEQGVISTIQLDVLVCTECGYVMMVDSDEIYEMVNGVDDV